MQTVMLVLIISISLTTFILSVPGGDKHKCDETELSTNKICKFTSLDGSVTMVPHKIDINIGSPNYVAVANKDGTRLKLGMKPWENGVKLIKSTDKIEGDEWMYVLAFELLAPLRDAVMYDPAKLKVKTEWEKLTKVYTDCRIKTKSIDLNAKGPNRRYGTDDIYKVITDTASVVGPLSVHTFILQWIEEGSADLYCLITTKNISDKHCPQIAALNGISTSDVSNCWENAYKGLYGSLTPAGGFTKGKSSSTPISTPTPTSPNSSTASNFCNMSILLIGLILCLILS